VTTTDASPRSRRGTVVLEACQRDADFLRHSGATVLLDLDFVIRAATPAYVAVTGRCLDELRSVHVFDAFPDNPSTPEEQPTRRLAESVEEALRRHRVQLLPTTRYDIPDPRRPGRFVEKRWRIVSAPVYDGDTVIGARVRGVDLALVEEDLVKVLSEYGASLADADLRTEAGRRRLDALQAYLTMAEEHGRLAAEVAGLREAMKTRPVIDQAKGLIMADRRCTPDEAFRIIKKLSMDTNVRVADVAAALVYQAQRP